MKDESKRWLDIADDDYDTSQYLFKGARHPQAVYFQGVIPMAKKSISQPITDFVNRLRKQCAVDKVILFGSSAAKSRRPDSDLDVIVVSKDFHRLDEDRRLNLLYRHSRFLKPEIHPWGLTPTELSTASRLTTIGYARDHGQIVYSKESA